ncbi:acetylcholine receptor subunit alpha-like isoform X1 [Branchiostoma floridae x Branchiostoma belcheri]
MLSQDEPGESITTATRIDLKWSDIRLKWVNSLYDLTKVFVEHDKIWKPKIKLRGSADKEFTGFPKDDLEMAHTGEVTWTMETILVTTCILDHFLFPFDNMTCHVCIRGDFRSDEIFVCAGVDEIGGDVITCHQHKHLKRGEWDVVYNLRVENKTACLELQLQRNSLYHMCTTVSPSIVLVLLMGITFCIPIDKGDRLSYGMSILLSMFVSLVVINDFLPKGSIFPLLGVLTITAIILMGVFMLATAVVISLSGREGALPAWARTVFLKHCAIAMRLGDLSKKRRKKAEEPPTVNNIEATIASTASTPERMPSFSVDRFNPEEEPRRRQNLMKILVSTNTVMWRIQNTLSATQNTLHKLNMWLGKNEEGDSSDSGEESEWMLLSRVLDRLCFVLYFSCLFLTLPIALYSRPN